MSNGITQVFVAVMLVALALLVGYQGYMLWWTKKQTGSVPGAIKVLRGVNIALLVAAGVIIVVWLAGR